LLYTFYNSKSSKVHRHETHSSSTNATPKQRLFCHFKISTKGLRSSHTQSIPPYPNPKLVKKKNHSKTVLYCRQARISRHIHSKPEVLFCAIFVLSIFSGTNFFDSFFFFNVSVVRSRRRQRSPASAARRCRLRPLRRRRRRGTRSP
jgi:hypothetical protein